MIDKSNINCNLQYIEFDSTYESINIINSWLSLNGCHTLEYNTISKLFYCKGVKICSLNEITIFVIDYFSPEFPVVAYTENEFINKFGVVNE